MLEKQSMTSLKKKMVNLDTATLRTVFSESTQKSTILKLNVEYVIKNR